MYSMFGLVYGQERGEISNSLVMVTIKEAASQKRWHSFLESVVNVSVGMAINVVAQHFIFPWFGLHISWTQNLGIAGIFTVISIARSFCLRRVFNRWHIRQVTTI